MKGKRIITVLCMLLVAFASYAGGSSENDDSVIIWHSNSGIIGTAFDEIIENFDAANCNMSIRVVKADAKYDGDVKKNGECVVVGVLVDYDFTKDNH